MPFEVILQGTFRVSSKFLSCVRGRCSSFEIISFAFRGCSLLGWVPSSVESVNPFLFGVAEFALQVVAVLGSWSVAAESFYPVENSAYHWLSPVIRVLFSKQSCPWLVLCCLCILLPFPRRCAANFAIRWWVRSSPLFLQPTFPSCLASSYSKLIVFVVNPSFSAPEALFLCRKQLLFGEVRTLASSRSLSF